mgnify:CR=1 FL=1
MSKKNNTFSTKNSYSQALFELAKEKNSINDLENQVYSIIELIRTPIWIFMVMILFSMAYNEPIWNDWYDFQGHVDLYVSALVSMMLMTIFVKSWCFSDCCC